MFFTRTIYKIIIYYRWNESNTCGNCNRNESITQSLTVSTPKDATVVMAEYLGLLSQQKLVHGMIVIAVGETRRDKESCLLV